VEGGGGAAPPGEKNQTEETKKKKKNTGIMLLKSCSHSGVCSEMQLLME
jgi:hypothetical protein